MRWPRLLRRRPRPTPFDPPPLTFHTEQRTIMTTDGPMNVRVPVPEWLED
jgi:hypothetical protein